MLQGSVGKVLESFTHHNGWKWNMGSPTGAGQHSQSGLPERVESIREEVY